LLFIAQKVKKGDFTLIENWSSTALFDDRPPVRARTYQGSSRIRFDFQKSKFLNFDISRSQISNEARLVLETIFENDFGHSMLSWHSFPCSAPVHNIDSKLVRRKRPSCRRAMRWRTRASMSFGAFRVRGIVSVVRGKTVAKEIRALLPLRNTATRACAASSRDDVISPAKKAGMEGQKVGHVTSFYMEVLTQERGVY
jgi:hypothetical protein